MSDGLKLAFNSSSRRAEALRFIWPLRSYAQTPQCANDFLVENQSLRFTELQSSEFNTGVALEKHTGTTDAAAREHTTGAL